MHCNSNNTKNTIFNLQEKDKIPAKQNDDIEFVPCLSFLNLSSSEK